MRVPRERVTSALAVALVLVSAACTGERGSSSAGEVSLSISKPAILQGAGGRNPTVAIDPRDGTAYMAWAQEIARPGAEGSGEDEGREAQLQVLLARSTDGGRTYEKPVVASGDNTLIASYSMAPTQVAVGAGGEVLVLYERLLPFPGHDYGRAMLRLARSTDGGRSFGPAVDVGTEEVEGMATGMEMFHLLVRPGGDVFVSWLDYRREFAEIGKRKEEGHGDKKGPPFEVRVARSTDGGMTFRPSVLVDGASCECCRSAMAAGPDGALHVVWRSRLPERNGSSDDVRDVMMSRSADDGVTWSKRVKVHDDGFLVNACPETTQGIGVDSGGRIHVAWYTGTEKAPGPGVYYAVSSDQGTTFSEPIALLTGKWVPYGDVKLAVDGENNAWVAFEDRRDEKVDRVVVARVDPKNDVALSGAWTGTAPDLVVNHRGAIVAWATEEGAIRAAVATAALPGSRALPAVTSPETR